MSDPKTKATLPAASSPEETATPVNEIEALQLPSRLPIIAIDNSVLFPFMIAPIVVSQEHDKALVDDVLKADRLLGVFLKKQSGGPDIFENLHDTGCLAVILKMLRMPDGAVRILLHGLERVKVVEPLSEDPYLVAGVERMVFDTAVTRPVQALMKSIQQMMQRVIEMANMPQDLATAVSSMEDPGRLADLVITHLPIKAEERQSILEIAGLEPRLHRVLEILSREADLLQLSSETRAKCRSAWTKTSATTCCASRSRRFAKNWARTKNRIPTFWNCVPPSRRRTCRLSPKKRPRKNCVVSK
jgi:ATP-dependent Lon protease